VRSLPRTLVTAVLFLGYALPVYWLLSISLKSTEEIFAHPAALVFRPSVSAYIHVIHEGIGRAAVSTLIVAGGTTVTCLLLALPAAYGLSRSVSIVVPAVLALLVVLQMVPQTSTVIPLYRVLGQWGLLGTYCGLILADTAMLLPFAVLVLRPFFRAVPRDVEEAAAVDGASPVAVFVRVVLPIARNGAMTVATLLFIITCGEFLYSINFLTDPRKYPLSATLAQQVTQYGIDWPALMAVSVLASVPAIVVFAAGQRSVVRGLSTGIGK
jgi:multiple sugar transport system permease protein